MQITVDLSRHCIETASRLRMEALIRDYFKHPEPDTDQAIQALTCFLEHTDFQALRHAMARETAAGPATAILRFSQDLSQLKIRFNDQDFCPPLKDRTA